MLVWPDIFLLATSSAGKAEELEAMLRGHGINSVIKTYKDFGLTAPEETGTRFAENALIKARAGVTATGLPTLADDSGLCVAELNGEPGVYSADWAENADGSRDFKKAMDRIDRGLGERPNRSAYFTCTLLMLFPNGQQFEAEGRVNGRLAKASNPTGDAGHGYDPWFIPDGYDQSFAVLGLDIKNALSHRARALQILLDKRDYCAGTATGLAS